VDNQAHGYDGSMTTNAVKSARVRLKVSPTIRLHRQT